MASVPLLFAHDYPSAGIFFGTAIHDTAQVTGSALSFQQLHRAPEVLNTATVVKIIRNLSMVILPALTIGYRYSAVSMRMTRSAMLEVLRERDHLVEGRNLERTVPAV